MDENVAGFDVSVEHALPMSVVERLCDIRRDLDSIINRKLFLSINAILERFARWCPADS